jgi:hypothetical protein
MLPGILFLAQNFRRLSSHVRHLLAALAQGHEHLQPQQQQALAQQVTLQLLQQLLMCEAAQATEGDANDVAFWLLKLPAAAALTSESAYKRLGGNAWQVRTS